MKLKILNYKCSFISIISLKYFTLLKLLIMKSANKCLKKDTLIARNSTIIG